MSGQIDYQVRTAFLNLTAAKDLVAVAQSNIDLASQTLVQARDRLAAGVAGNLEVVQAQESVATANQSYISSLFTYNSAKVVAGASHRCRRTVCAYLPRSQVAMEKPQRRTAVIGLGLLALVIALVAGVLVYRHYARLESTDDAQIDGYIYPITSRVSGYVTRVTVDDNQYVRPAPCSCSSIPKTTKSRSPTPGR